MNQQYMQINQAFAGAEKFASEQRVEERKTDEQANRSRIQEMTSDQKGVLDALTELRRQEDRTAKESFAR